MKKIRLLASIAIFFAFSCALGACSPSINEVPAIDTQDNISETTSENSADESNNEKTSATNQVQNYPMAPDFALPGDFGPNISLSGYKGNIVVLNFWASWCGYCVQEMPDFQEMVKDWAAQKSENPDINTPVFLAINCGEDRETSQKFMKKNGFNFTVLYDESAEVTFSYSPSGSLPTTIIIDEEGRIRDTIIGMTSREAVEESIAKIQASHE